jgi:formate dehydrogenase subunit beta
MEDRLREIVSEFLSNPGSACFIGYEASPLGGTRPVVIHGSKGAERLVWNLQCYANLTTYLPDLRGENGVVGISVKGCDARALRELDRAGQVDRSKLFVVGLPCKGLVEPGGEALAERCYGCEFPEDFHYDAVLGPMQTPDLPERGVEEAEAGGSLEERRLFWERELDKCISCEACRKICYACFCPECIFELPTPRWISRGGGRAEKFFYHATRALHLAGRCIGCGECERACPAGVRLTLLSRRLERSFTGAWV